MCRHVCILSASFVPHCTLVSSYFGLLSSFEKYSWIKQFSKSQTNKQIKLKPWESVISFSLILLRNIQTWGLLISTFFFFFLLNCGFSHTFESIIFLIKIIKKFLKVRWAALDYGSISSVSVCWFTVTTFQIKSSFFPSLLQHISLRS